MATGLSDYVKNKLLRHLAKAEVWAPPANWYYTLHAAAWNPAGGIANEFASGNMARIAVAVNGVNFGVAANVLSLLVDQAGVELNAQQAAGANALCWVAYDAAAAGNVMAGGDLAAGDQKAYTANDQIVVKGVTSTITLT